MLASLAVGPPRDIQPTRATLVGACASATSGASTIPKTIMRRKVTCPRFNRPKMILYKHEDLIWRASIYRRLSREAHRVTSKARRLEGRATHAPTVFPRRILCDYRMRHNKAVYRVIERLLLAERT